MSKQQAAELLKHHAQRLTSKRIALLDLLMESSRAFTLSEIEKRLHISMDRVTIYRTLQTYEAIGLAMKMVDRNGCCMYMFNHDAHRDTQRHPYLHCRECDKVICLPGLPNEYLAVLQKYEIKEMYFLMEGLCPDCLANGENHDDE